jgi:hypothetical protein
MSLATRRTLSWLGTLAVLTSLAALYTLLPGYGGAVGETRWLLARRAASAHTYRQAGGLLLALEQRGSGQRAAAFRELLRDRDPTMVDRTLRLLADRLQHGPDLDSSAMRAAFGEWYVRASVEEKVTHLPWTLLCADPRPTCGNERVFWFARRAPQPDRFEWPNVMTDDDARWMVAATLQTNPDAQAMIDGMLFKYPLRAHRDILLRLRTLDALPVSDLQNVADASEPVELELLDEDAVVSSRELLDMLADPIAQARWAAARILTVAGDQRGLPAFREWVKTKRKLPPAAEKMMTDLFGPNWRDPAFTPQPATAPPAPPESHPCEP